jgi:putative ABC transport system permease protein
MQLRGELAARWRAWFLLALVAGLAGGAAIATAACARRTDSALTRYRTFSRQPDVYVGTGLTFGLQRLDLARIRRLPQVRAVSRGVLPNAEVLHGGGGGVDAPVQLEVLPDPDGLDVVDRPKLLAGRLPTPGRPDEAVADARAMRAAHLELGDTLSIRLRLGRGAVAAPPIALQIVGVRPDVYPVEAGSFVSATPGSFYRAHGGSQIAVAALRNALKVRLWHGAADLPAFERGAERLAHGHDFQFTPFDVGAAKLQSGLHLQAEALWAAAILGAAASWLVIGQGVTRLLEREARKDPTLLALGMTLGGLRQLAMARALLIGGMVVAVAVPVAVGLSPLGPLGRAGDLEPAPGMAIDPPILIGGAAVLLVAALLSGATAALRAGRTRAVPVLRAGDADRTTAGDLMARAGLPPVVVAGTRMALPPRQTPTRGSARAAIVGATLAVAVISMALTFAASLSHLLHTPRLSGLTWDYASPQGFGTELDRIRIQRDTAIGAAAFGEDARLVIGGRQVGVAAYDDIKGHVAPTVIAGRAPSRTGEILLGTKIFGALGARLGERIAVRRGNRVRRMLLVGRGVLPDGLFINLGEGSAMTFGSLHALLPGAFRSRFLIRIAPGADRNAVLGRLERTYGAPRAGLPSEISDFGGVRRMPLLIAALVGFAAAVTLTCNGLTSVRRRRRELAILMTLGFTRGQVRRAVAWQATLVVAIAALVGVPLGAGAGRWAWEGFATHTGFASQPVTPLGHTALVVPVAILAANLLALVPAALAARREPAAILRAE